MIQAIEILNAGKMPNKRRKRPEDLAREYCEQGTDPNGFEKRHINDVIGYGLFATRSFSKGDFLLEYRGVRSCVGDHNDEGTREPEPYVLYYDYIGKTYRIDASDPDSGLARYINDEWRHPNAVVNKVVVSDTTVHLCLFALEDVKAGEELRYNYRVDDLPWRKQVQAPQCNVQTPPEDEQYCPTVVETDDKVQTPPEDEQCCPTVVETDDKIQTPPEDEQYCPAVVEMDDKIQTPPEDDQYCSTVVETDDKIQTPPEAEQYRPTVVETDDKVQTLPKVQYCPTDVETDDKIQNPPEDEQYRPTVVETDDKVQTLPEVQYCPNDVETDDKIQTPPEDEQYCPTVVETDADYCPSEDEQDSPTVVETDADYCPSEDEHQSVDGNDVFYPTVKRSKEGKRVYNKHQACYYCGQLKTKISKHLLACHCDETEVAQIAALPRNSKERQIKFELLRNKGNYYHNINVLNTNEGELILVRRPGDKDIFDQEDYGPCPYCLGFFKRNDLWKHIRYLCHDMQVQQLFKRSTLKIGDQSSVSQQKQRKSRCMVKDVPEFEDSSPESDAQSKQKKRKETERSEYVPESEYSSPESDAEPKQMKRKKTKRSRDVLESEYSSPESDVHPKQKKRTKTKKSKGNRRPWSKEETHAVWKYFHEDIKKGNTPGKIPCMRCIQQNEVLKERSWRDVKYKVRNSVVSMRNSRK